MLYWGPSPCLFLSSGDSFPGLWQHTHMLSLPIHLKVSCKHQDTHIYTYAHTCIYILTHTHEAGVSGSQGWVIDQSGPKHPHSTLTLFRPSGNRTMSPCLLPHVIKTKDKCVQMPGRIVGCAPVDFGDRTCFWTREGFECWCKKEGSSTLPLRGQECNRFLHNDVLFSRSTHIHSSASFYVTICASGATQKLAQYSQTVVHDSWRIFFNIK